MVKRNQEQVGSPPSSKRSPGGCKIVLAVSAADVRRAREMPLLTLSASDLMSELTLGRFLILEQSARSRYLLIENAPCLSFVPWLREALHQIKGQSPASVPDMYQRFDLQLERVGDAVAIRDSHQPKQPGINVDIRSLGKELHAASQEIFDTVLLLIPELSEHSDLEEIRRKLR